MPVSVTLSLIDLTDPFKVNAATSGLQTFPSATGLASGGFVAGYSINPTNPNPANLLLDFFTPAYAPINGTDITGANRNDTASNLTQMSLTQLNSGNVVFVYSDQGIGHGGEFYARILGPDGSTVGGSDVPIDLHVGGSTWGADVNFGADEPQTIEVAARPDGGFFVTYNDQEHVRIAAYDSTGHMLYVTQASQAATQADSNYLKYNFEGTTAEFAGGGYVVVYDHFERSRFTADKDYDVRAVVLNDDGSVRVADFVIEQSDDGKRAEPQVAALPDGDFAVVYRNDRLAGEDDSAGLTLRIVSPTGSVGASIHVNTATSSSDELDPAITVLANGFIVVTWNKVTGTASELHERIFDQHGAAITGDTLVRDSAAGFDDGYSSVAHLLDGQFVTAWQENTPGDGSSTQITARVQEVVRTTTGTDSADVLNGDGLHDTILAGGGADVVNAGGGDDFISGEAGNDFLRGEDGDDLIVGGANDDQIEGGNGNDTLHGDDGDDKLFGGIGNDNLDGNAGFDTLSGGPGDDVYTLGSGAAHDVGGGLFLFSYDTVFEDAGEGTDTVHVVRTGTSGLNLLTSYTLTTNVENGVIDGATAFNLTGNASANNLTGNGAANTLSGLGGNDILTGLGGDDRFVFAPGGGTDTVTDFAAGAGTLDRIDLSAFHTTFGAVMSHATQFGSAAMGFDFGHGDKLFLNFVQKTDLRIDDFVGLKAASNDFNTDGNSDIVWHNDSGAASIWDSGQIGAAHIIAAADAVPAGWHIAGRGDFDGNGHSDILWQNDNTSVSIWDDGAIDQAHIVSGPGVVPAGWHISGTGDFDGNGHSDILWRNDDGSASIWDNGAIGSAHIIAGAGSIPSGWSIAGTGDFDGNGKSDILWHRDDGTVAIWDNGQIAGAHWIANPGVVPAGWSISGAGDFDGNRQDDILWHNDNSAVSIWDNGAIGSAHIVSAAGVVATAWHISGTGDFDGNRQDDILWRNDNGAASIWDNGDINQAHIIADAGAIPSGWHIV